MLGRRAPDSTLPPNGGPSEPSYPGILDSLQMQAPLGGKTRDPELLRDLLLWDADADTKPPRRKETGRGRAFLEVQITDLSLCSRDRSVPPYPSPRLPRGIKGSCLLAFAAAVPSSRSLSPNPWAVLGLALPPQALSPGP